MLARSIRAAAGAGERAMSTGASKKKVAVVGAAGGIGQPLSLLLMSNLAPMISHLSLFDIINTPGVAADLSHVPNAPTVSGHVGNDELGNALDGCDVVVVPAGMPRKPGMSRDDLFKTNATVAMSIATACAEHCPEAHLAIITNPVNSTVPIVAETLKRAGTYDPKRLFGVTTLDVCRANKFVAESQGWDPAETDVTVIGGHAGTTILPLLSQVEGATFTDEQRDELTNRIQFGGDIVVKAKDGAGSATLSMAYAAARFTGSLLRALNGETGIRECAFVESSVAATPFFASPVTLGTEGVAEVHGFGKLSDFEQAGYDEMIGALGSQIQKGVDFVAST